jgi:hypothetical protein
MWARLDGDMVEKGNDGRVEEVVGCNTILYRCMMLFSSAPLGGAGWTARRQAVPWMMDCDASNCWDDGRSGKIKGGFNDPGMCRGPSSDVLHVVLQMVGRSGKIKGGFSAYFKVVRGC